MAPFLTVTVPAMLVAALGACSPGPLRVDRERRVYPSVSSAFSDRVITHSALAADDGRLYFGTGNGYLYALRAADGKKEWRRKFPGSIDTPPHAAAGRVYFGTSQARFFAVAAWDGSTLWSQEVGGEVTGRPGLAGKAVLFGANDAVLYALEAETGEVRWRYRSDLPDRISLHAFATPASAEDAVYAAFGDGSVAALRLRDGGEIWRERFAERLRFPEIVAPLLLKEGKLVAAQYFGGLHLLRSGGGSLWSVRGAGSYAPPLLHEGVLYSGGAGGEIVAVDFPGGSKRWVRNVGAKGNWSGLTLFGGRLVASTFDGVLYVLDPADGTLLWRYEFAAAIPGAPAVAGQRLWVLTSDGRLYRMALQGGARGGLDVAESLW